MGGKQRDRIWGGAGQALLEAAEDRKEQACSRLLTLRVSPAARLLWGLVHERTTTPRRRFPFPGFKGGLAFVLAIWIESRVKLGTGGVSPKPSRTEIQRQAGES